MTTIVLALMLASVLEGWLEDVKMIESRKDFLTFEFQLISCFFRA